MFTDEKTNIRINANLCESVIHGTHRSCDLIPAFLDVIKETPQYLQMSLCAFPSVISDPSASESDERWEEQETQDFLLVLFEVCELYAPDGYYFGSLPGDGSDFGYWNATDPDDLVTTLEQYDFDI